MSLAKRLDKLRAQAGIKGSGAQQEQLSLHERLKRSRPISLRRDPPNTPRRPSPDGDELAKQLGAQHIEQGLLEIEVEVGLHSSYGRQPLAPLRDSLPNLPAGAGLPPSRALFLDVETTGLAGGAGTIAFLIGAGRLDGATLRIKQWLLSGFAGEPSQLRQLTRQLEQIDGLVTYNGKSFDLPLLKNRARLNGVDLGMAEGLTHLDLLHPTRRAFRGRWPNCRLITAERLLLGRERIDDLPGSEAPAAWLDYLQRGDGRRLSDVLQHNADDLLALAALWIALDRLHATADKAMDT